MSATTSAIAVGFVAWLALFGAAAFGWVVNIIKIIADVGDPITGLFVLRCFGIIAAPLGAILGYF